MGVLLWAFNTVIHGKMYGAPLILLSSVLSNVNSICSPVNT